MKSLGGRRMFLGIGLLSTLVLVWFAPPEQEGNSPEKGSHAPDPGKSARPSARPASTPVRGDDRPGLGRLNVAERIKPDEVPDLFKALSWYVPPPPPPLPAPSPPPPPSAPPLPFAFLGQYIEDGKQLLLLTRGDRVVTARVGDVITNTYRLEGFRGEYIDFVYLPLNIKQTLKTDGGL